MRRHASLALGILLVTGCTPLPAQLKPYPGIEQQILDYYNRQLINEGPDCLETQMQGISALHVLRDTPHHVVVRSSTSSSRTTTTSTAAPGAQARTPGCSPSTRPAGS